MATTYQIIDETTNSKVTQTTNTVVTSTWLFPKTGIDVRVQDGHLYITYNTINLKIPRVLIDNPVSATDIELADNVAFMIDSGSSGNSNWVGVLAGSPVSGAAGDWYTNESTGEAVYYDAVRSTWLSSTQTIVKFGRLSVPNNTRMLVGGSLEPCTDITAAPSLRGEPIPFNGVITTLGVSCQTNPTEDSIVQVYVNNASLTPIHTETISVGTLIASKSNLNISVAAGDVLGVKVLKGGTMGGTTTYLNGTLTIQRKY